MKAAYLLLGMAMALGAAALAGPGTRVRSPDSSVSAAGNQYSSSTDETDRREKSMTYDKDSGRVTTTVRNGNNFASVTQSGDPGSVVKQVETRPGYTKLEQHSGTSRSVVVQSSDPADLPLDQFSRAFRELF